MHTCHSLETVGALSSLVLVPTLGADTHQSRSGPQHGPSGPRNSTSGCISANSAHPDSRCIGINASHHIEAAAAALSSATRRLGISVSETILDKLPALSALSVCKHRVSVTRLHEIMSNIQTITCTYELDVASVKLHAVHTILVASFTAMVTS